VDAEGLVHDQARRRKRHVAAVGEARVQGNGAADVGVLSLLEPGRRRSVKHPIVHHAADWRHQSFQSGVLKSEKMKPWH
jgi:hypothetical protein